MAKYELFEDAKVRIVHLAEIPFITLRENPAEDYPWDKWVLTIGGIGQNVLYDDGVFYIDLITDRCEEKSVEEAEALAKLVEGMSKEEEQEFMQGKITNFRDRIEHKIFFRENGEICNLAGLVDQLISSI